MRRGQGKRLVVLLLLLLLSATLVRALRPAR